MKHLHFVLATSLTVAAAIPIGAQVQQSARKIEPATTSAEARAAFLTALDAANNIFPLRARTVAAQAIAADPSFGLARVLWAAASPEMPATQRTAELDRGVADAARASVGELLFAAAIRSNVAGRTAEAHTIAGAATALVPDDPNVAYFYAQTSPAAELREALRDVTKRFAEFAPPYNVLAYQLYAAGDSAGALQTIQMYMRLASAQPNPHDSYAELLQFSGRLPEALAHYEAAARLDSAYDQAYAGMGEVHLLMGHGDQSRAAYAVAIARAPTAIARINSTGARALTFVADGKPKDAIRELSSLAMSAEQQNLKPQAAATYRAMALIEAVFGDRNAVAGNLAKAAALGGAEVPAQLRIAGIVYALTGDIANARAAAAKFRDANVSGTAAQQNASHELDAIVAAADKDLATAQAELAKAGPSPTLGRAVVAEALKKAGRKSEAESLRALSAKTGTVTLFDVVGRTKLARL